MQHLSYPPDKKNQKYQFSFHAKLGKGTYGTVYPGKNIYDSTHAFLLIRQQCCTKSNWQKLLETDNPNQLMASEIQIVMTPWHSQNLVELTNKLDSKLIYYYLLFTSYLFSIQKFQKIKRNSFQVVYTLQKRKEGVGMIYLTLLLRKRIIKLQLKGIIVIKINQSTHYQCYKQNKINKHNRSFSKSTSLTIDFTKNMKLRLQIRKSKIVNKLY